MTKRKRIGAVGLAGVLLCAVIGVFAGVSGFTFTIANGASYMSNDPAACINCHVMREQYDSWQKSSHHAHAVCNDCHVPHDVLGKYFTKAEHGFRHSWGFTFQDFHEPIQMKESSRAVVAQNCQYCHGALVSEIIGHSNLDHDPTNCIRCHENVGHGANR